MTTINNLTKHDCREFKAGDLVVFDTTKEFCAKLPDDLMEFRVRKDIDAIVTQGSRWFAVSFVAIRHATPSEIKAGHRIDDTTDHVTDIRNHVSPSTIIKDLEAERHG